MSRTREELFKAIKAAYKEKDEASIRRGRLPMRSTEKGFWGVSHLDDVYDFFTQKDFPQETRFIDLGCGDGRVALVASLFVNATGIEWDEALVAEGRAIAAELGMDVKLFVGDMRDLDYREYDALYMYADQNFAFLRQKLLSELRGTLYLYHDTYHPEYLAKGRITWVGQIPVFSYTVPPRQE